ncbi:MAG: hypothetical protein ACYDEV_00035 [Acidiferrobacter sp.]
MSHQDNDFISALLSAMAKMAADRGNALTKLRLVKFLYLFDLFWAQHSKGVTYTGWPWAFVHYGPYCRQSTDAIDTAERNGYLIAQSFESRFGDSDYRLYGVESRIAESAITDIERHVPLTVRTRFFSAIRKWYDDTAGLLDHVYFHTGPMKNAHPRDTLSFTDEHEPNWEQFRPIQMRPLSAKKKKALQQAFRGLKKERHIAHQNDTLFDKEYFAFLSALAESEPETETGLSGTASLEFHRQPDD